MHHRSSAAARPPSVLLLLSLLGAGCASDNANRGDPGDERPAASATVDEDGGDIETGDGASISVPPGGLPSATTIEVAPVGDTEIDAAELPEDTELAGSAFAFTPHGTEFERPAVITLPHAGQANAVLRLADEDDTTWEEITDVVVTADTISFETTTFSIYAPARAQRLVCDPGTWDHDGEADTPCRPWSDCAPGERVQDSGTAASDRACAPCTNGTFSTEDNAASCSQWSDCLPGTAVSELPTATADRVCQACPSGAYADTTNANACVTWTDCAPGQYVATAPTARSDRACAPCALGTESAETNAVTCTDIDECAVENGGCGDAQYTTCTNNEAVPPTCSDIDECINDNGGCGDPARFECVNQDGRAPVCVDVDECATDNGGCGDPAFFECVNQNGAAPLCLDIDECAIGNGGCGDPIYTTCANNEGAPPTCIDIDECATDNGGCGDPVFFECENQSGAGPVCLDINECATDNGGCGDAALFECVNQTGRAPLCVDIDECATDNGGCGDPIYTACANNEGAPPTCIDIDECATDNGGCGSPEHATCIDNEGAAPTCECVQWALPESPEQPFRLEVPDNALVGETLTFNVVATGAQSVGDYELSWFVDAYPEPEPELSGSTVQMTYSQPSRYRIQVQAMNRSDASDTILLMDYVNIARPFADTVYALAPNAGPQDVKAWGEPGSGNWCAYYYDVYYGKYTEFWKQQGVPTTQEQITHALAFADYLFEFFIDFIGWDYRADPSQRYTLCNDVRGGGAGREGMFLTDEWTPEGKPILHELLAVMAHEYIHTWDFRANSFLQGPDSAHALTDPLERLILADLDWAFLGDYNGETMWVEPDFFERHRAHYVLKRYLENPNLSWETYFSDELMSLSSSELWNTVDIRERQERLYVQGGFLAAIRDMHGHEALKAFFHHIDRGLAADPLWNIDVWGPNPSSQDRLATMFRAMVDVLQVDIAPYFDYWKVPLTEDLRAYAGQYPRSRMLDDGDGDGVSPLEGDLDDCDASVYPGAPEIADGKDNNQEGQVDEHVYDESVIGDFQGLDIQLPALIIGEISSKSDIDQLRLRVPAGKRLMVVIHPLDAPEPAPYAPGGSQMITVYSGNVRIGHWNVDSIADWTSGEGVIVSWGPSTGHEMAITLDAHDRPWANGVPGKYEIQLVPEGYEAAPWNAATVIEKVFPGR